MVRLRPDGTPVTGSFVCRYFAGEIIGSVLELEPRRWRRPKRISPASQQDRVKGYRAKYKKYDWTGMLEK